MTLETRPNIFSWFYIAYEADSARTKIIVLMQSCILSCRIEISDNPCLTHHSPQISLYFSYSLHAQLHDNYVF
jgi:hypothetical protein